MSFNSRIHLFLALFLISTSPSAYSQLSKNSPFLERKNHLGSLKTSTEKDVLVLVHRRCDLSTSGLPQWFKAEVKASSLKMNTEVIKVPKEKFSEKEFTLHLNHSCVLGVGEDHPVFAAGLNTTHPNDPLFSQQVFLDYSGFLDYFRVQSSPAIDLTEPAIVAIIDSGISVSHPEFLGRHWVGPDGNFGYNFVSQSFNVEDDSGHGSHVSGLVGAIANNGAGIVGIGINVRLMTLKALDKDGMGSSGDLANAIRYATDHGADLINLSLTVDNDNPFVRDAIDYALEHGVVVVAASGNHGVEITKNKFFSPAGLAPEYMGLISVGSVDSESRKLSFFSNYSDHYVEIAAPGSHGMSQILSTYKNGRYFGLAGTSMSAPQVSGALAQVISFFKSNQIPYDPQMIESLLLESSNQNKNLLGSIRNGSELNLDALSKAVLKHMPFLSNGGLDD